MDVSDAVLLAFDAAVDLEGAAPRHGTQGIAGQVPEDLTDLVRICDQRDGRRFDDQIQMMLR